MIKLSSDSQSIQQMLSGVLNQMFSDKIKIITPEAVLEALNISAADEEEYASALNWAVRELESEPALIAAESSKAYMPKAQLFNNSTFLITPDAFEIENNILIPGHRFAVFMDEEIFPSEITLREVGARKPQSFRKLQASAETLLKYHLFMGSEGLFDFFAAEDESNMTQTAEDESQLELTISALDMSKFYREVNFAEGDALQITVKDFANGVFEFNLAGEHIHHPEKMKKYRQLFNQTLQAALAGGADNRAIIEQLQITIANAPDLLKQPILSLDELLLKDSIFDIVFDPDGSTIICQEDPDGDCDCGCEDHHHHHHDSDAIPDGLSISAGATDNLGDMLQNLYPVLNQIELDGIMLDSLYRQEFDFNSIYARAFGETLLDFADPAQEVAFFNALEERLEELQETYPRDFDEQTGPLRSDIVEFNIQRCTVLNELAELDELPELPAEWFEKLAEATLQLDEILNLLNHPEALGEDCDIAELSEAVEDALEAGAAALNQLTQALEDND